MDIDRKSLCDEQGELKIVIENRSLEEKYQELMKEITDKVKLMEDQIKEKEDGLPTMRDQMFNEMGSKEELIKKETQTYIEKLEQSKGEEDQMSKIHNEYKIRYAEFEKSIKTTQKNLSMQEAEARQLDKSIN